MTKSGKRPKKRVGKIDEYVGEQIRKYQLLRGLTLMELARDAGVQFQQVQKYESGANRISASRLVKMAEALDTTIPVLFGKYVAIQAHEGLFERHILKLIRAYNRLPAAIQGKFYELVAEMGRKG